MTGSNCRVGDIALTRSGDKGSLANVGVWACTDAAYDILREQLSEEVVAGHFAALSPGHVTRYELPNLRALNFVIVGLLGEGVAASTRLDGQAKSLGEYLRAKRLDMPVSLLEGS